jgi:hypothetical protein
MNSSQVRSIMSAQLAGVGEKLETLVPFLLATIEDRANPLCRDGPALSPHLNPVVARAMIPLILVLRVEQPAWATEHAKNMLDIDHQHGSALPVRKVYVA